MDMMSVGTPVWPAARAAGASSTTTPPICCGSTGKRMTRPAKVRPWCLNIPNPYRSPVDRACADAVAEAHIPARTIAPMKAERVLPIRSLLTMCGFVASLLCLQLVSEAAGQGKVVRLQGEGRLGPEA